MQATIVRSEGLDKFYTLPAVASHCISLLTQHYAWDHWDFVIEPSAGNGSFFTQIPVSYKIGMDIQPEHDEIIQCDYFTYVPPTSVPPTSVPPTDKQNILVLGNPPFGKVCSLAIQFFQHSSKIANVIAFIVPRTFRRVSVQNRLDPHFHLVLDHELPTKPCCFEPAMMVKCCFQIWEKRGEKRPIVKLPTTHRDWNFLSFGPNDENGQPTPPENADFAVRAYGGKCGDIRTSDLATLRPKSWHWIKSNIDVNILIQRFQQLDYSNSMNTARQNSMGRGEFVRLYSELFDAER